MANTSEIIALQEAENKLVDSIYEQAERDGLSTPDCLPITDGLYSAECYLNSSPRILWILQEPYDDSDDNGQPYGGGWSLPVDTYNKDDTWKNATMQYIIYSMFAFYNHYKYEELDWLRDNPTMQEVLKRIAYINVGKMPAYPTTPTNRVADCYAIWKNILLEQISLYKPNFIIFGGTFDVFKKDLFGEESPSVLRKYIKDDINYINVYKMNDVIMLSAYHPKARKPKGIRKHNYINCIIEALCDFTR